MKATILFFIVLFTISCRESSIEMCGVSDPITELAWLRDEVAQISTQQFQGMDTFVYSASYQGRPVFFVDLCCPVCNTAPPEVRNCEGASLGRLGDGVPADEVVNRSLIWNTENGVCTRD